MRIIQIAARENGSRPPIQTWTGAQPPEGYAVVPDTLDLRVWTEYSGFVALAVEDGVATGMSGNAAALASYRLSLPEPGEAMQTDAQRLAALEVENRLLAAKVAAQSDQMDFYEECIAEMAAVVYA